MAISLLAHTKIGTGGASTTPSINTTGATLITAVIGGWVSSVSGITDNKSNTWTLARPRKASPNACELAFFEMIPGTVGSGHTFSVSGSFATLCIAAWSGPVRNYVTAAASSVTSSQPGALTVPTNLETLILAGISFEVAATLSIDSGFTIADQNPFIGSTAFGSALAYKVATADVNPTWSWSGATHIASGTVIYREAGAAAGGNRGALASGLSSLG
jgi:hypothetical protein